MKKKKIIIAVVAVITILVMLGCGFGMMWIFNKEGVRKVFQPLYGNATKKNKAGKLIDDWQYDDKEDDDKSGYSAGVVYESSAGVKNSAVTDADATLGFSTGGAKDVENFRENIKNNYLPISTDLTYNGLFYDYYFNTGKNEGNGSDEMFYPTYSTAVSKDPISGYNEYYMTVGLNSNIKESDFQRKKLNLVVVMDISGSMSSGFNNYYYDGKSRGEEENRDSRSKMQIANESLNCLIDQLKPEDRLGIVLFDNSAYLAKPINLVGETDTDKIKEHILEIQARDFPS